MAGQGKSALITPGRGNVLAGKCPSRPILRTMTSQWGVLVLMVLRGRTLRFSQLRREIEGVSERMLSETLKRLEGNGLVRRVAYPVVPPVTEYSLTELGRAGADRVSALADWVETNLPAILEARPAEQDGSSPP